MLVASVSAVSYDSSLSLCQKDTTNWACIEGATATLEYNSVGQEFEYELTTSDSFEEDYVLIYYADEDPRFKTWGGNPALYLGTLEAGSITLSDSIDTGSLPFVDDWNMDCSGGENYCDYNNGFDDYDNCYGAKIWLVPSSDYDGEDKVLDAWNPDAFLFETDLISYVEDDDGPTITGEEVIPEWPSCTGDLSIFATITDFSEINLDSVILNYHYDSLSYWETKHFTIPPVDDIYEIMNPVDFPSNGETLTYFIEAADEFGNMGYSVENKSFKYDCANPTAGVEGESQNWVGEDDAIATCDDDASGCNIDSYKLYISPTVITECPEDEGLYSSPGSQLVEQHSWVCSYVEDNAGNHDFSDEPVEFLVDGVDPEANANGPYTCDEGETIELDGTGSTDDTVGGLLAYAWDLDNDGDYDDSTDSNPPYTCGNGNDVLTVSLEVTDLVGNTDTDDSSVEISNVAPRLDELSTFECNEGQTLI